MLHSAQCNIAVKLRYLIHRDDCICPGLRHFPQWWRWWWFYCSTTLLSMMVLPIMMTMMTLTRMGARGRCLEMTLKCVTIAIKTFATHSSIWWIVFHYICVITMPDAACAKAVHSASIENGPDDFSTWYLVRFPNPLASGSDIHGSWGTWLHNILQNRI